ncbi:MAG TPA: hypothetical protein PLZ47_08075 [Candidatus Cloacimonas acidaminovorans]|nr:hypothetical protein [Candidatus Cloacimonas acidaminovorans]
MAIYEKYGFAIDQILSENQALPNATSSDSTNTIKLDAVADDGLHIVVCAASTTVELASSATLEIRPTIGATEGTVTTVLPSILIKEGVQSDVSWAPGEMICQFNIPAKLIGSARYLKLTYVTSADESDDKVEAFSVRR